MGDRDRGRRDAKGLSYKKSYVCNFKLTLNQAETLQRIKKSGIEARKLTSAACARASSCRETCYAAGLCSFFARTLLSQLLPPRARPAYRCLCEKQHKERTNNGN